MWCFFFFFLYLLNIVILSSHLAYIMNIFCFVLFLSEQIYEKASKQLFEELAHVYRESGKGRY